MSFTSRRGRPPKAREEKLTKPKKSLSHNQEIVDVLHKKGLITDEELWAAMHFRWLYTLRFGAPNISAIDIGRVSGKVLKLEDPEWQAAREREYGDAVDELRSIKANKIVMNIAVFDICPKFLIAISSFKDLKRIAQNHDDFSVLISGLDLLCKIWGKDNSRYQK